VLLNSKLFVDWRRFAKSPRQALQFAREARHFTRGGCRLPSTGGQLYLVVGFAPPWIGYLVQENEVCVGSCGFKGPPVNKRVEIAYFAFPEHEGRGFATQMARLLLRIVNEADAEVIATAQTLPRESASTAILKKLGFVLIGTVNDPEDGEVWEWQIGGE
jgi:RimJ/RimL family protein N-acetyltransferase